MLLSCHHIAKSFSGETVLADVTFGLESGRHMAVVGPNGCGKSTLLKVIMGSVSPDAGSVVFSRDATAGYLSQQPETPEDGTLQSFMLQSCGELVEMESQLRAMEAEMAQLSPEAYASETGVRLMERYASLSERFSRLDGPSFRSRITGVLKGLGFLESEFQRPLSSLSGGQQTRAALAALLVRRCDLLILDEPVNHLDLSSIQWLEGFLSSFNGALLLVAHDRYFLDRVCDQVLDLSGGTAALYEGNYTRYAAQRDARAQALRRAWEKQQAEIRHQEAVIERLRAYNREKSVRRAESRQKLLDRMERIERPQQQTQQVRLSFSSGSRSGQDVLLIRDLAKSYGHRVLFSGVSLEIRRGERIAVTGDNGTGKTTLLKILNGQVKADAGSCFFGANVRVGYYDQAQQNLSDDRTVFSEIADSHPEMKETEIRNALAAFLFTGDDVFKQVLALSGGERGRLSLLKLMLSDANFLILDEPTNHLDMETKEVLEEALCGYEGTLLFVSHDRYFISRLADRILMLSGGQITDYPGSYEDWLYHTTALKDETPKGIPAQNARSTAFGGSFSEESQKPGRDLSASANPAFLPSAVLADAHSAEDWQKHKQRQARLRQLSSRLSACEERIAMLEQETERLNKEGSDPSVATDAARLGELYEQQEEVHAELDRQMEIWTELSEALESEGENK